MTQHGLSKEELIQELRRLEQQLGTVPATTDMNESGKYSVPPYYRVFGSWKEALSEAGFEPQKAQKSRSTEELLTELHRVAKVCDRTPTKADMRTHGDPAADTYDSRFGSWNAALEAAGFTPNQCGTLSIAELCTALQELADELGHRPTSLDMYQHGAYSAGTYVNRFGSWDAALRTAGFDADTDKNNQIATEDLCAALQALAAELNRQPTSTDMDRDGPHSASTYIDRFGSWDAALYAVNLTSTS